MQITSLRTVNIQFTNGLEYAQSFAADQNVLSPGETRQASLVTGNNTIDVPEGATAVNIIPLEDNEETITLKGVNGDTGIALAMTSVSSIGLNEVTSFVLNVTDDITVVLIFT